MAAIEAAVHRLAAVFEYKFAEVFLTLGSMFSLASLASALVLAIIAAVWARWRRGRSLRARPLLRTILPHRALHGASMRADFGLFLVNILPAVALLGWAVISARDISAPLAAALARALGPAPDLGLPGWLVRTAATLALFLAYDFAYWFDHYLKHKVPALWDFHRVHHTAEALSPLTTFRVHPIDSLVFANIVAVALGLVAGGLDYAFGPAGAPFTVSGTNLILIVFVFTLIHLQHSHVWISFPAPLGRLLLSPAHHQIHHSTDPRHFNRNFGSCLAIWDWAFGTLHIPSQRRERLTFGVETPASAPSPHSAIGTLITPFGDLLARAPWPRARGSRLTRN